jgi:hypothetical protein
MNAQPDLGVKNLEDDSTILPGAEVRVVAEPVVERQPKNVLARYKKRVWLVLEDNDNIPPTGQFFGHNGVGFMLKPGVAAEVPVELLDILNNAVYEAPEVDQATRQIIGYKPRLRFPYRLIQKPAA